MSTGGITMMLITEILIIVITGYFFYKVLFTKPNPEPDSYSENDNEPHIS